MSVLIGSDARRIDGSEKVRGRPIFAADQIPDGVAHAVMAVASIGKGKIVDMNVEAAEQLAGVLVVLTHRNMDRLEPASFSFAGGSSSESFQPLQSDVVAYRGHPIAVVVAETLQIATEAASLVTAQYSPAPFSVELHDDGGELLKQPDVAPNFQDVVIGDAEEVLDDAAFSIDAVYATPAQHHNAMELLSTVAVWRGDDLVIHEGTQASGRLRQGLATQLGIAAERIRVISPYVGGGFGGRGSMGFYTVLAAVAARRVGRAVKLIVPRPHVFHAMHFRPATEHHIRLGADPEGRIIAATHAMRVQTSRADTMPFWGAETTSRMYDIPNFRSATTLVRLDTQTPGFMRGPMEMSACFALESAVDELALKLQMDPVKLRLLNDTQTDPVTGKPFSSRRLKECLERGAQQFGWSMRSAAPRSMRSADGALIGWGMAAGAYPGMWAPAAARLRLFADGAAELSVTGHEMGQGLRTTVGLVAADGLGIDPQQINITMGDTAAPPQGPSGGSWGSATAVPPVRNAVSDLRQQLHALAKQQQSEVGRVPASSCVLAGGRLVGPDGVSVAVAELMQQAGIMHLESSSTTLAPGQGQDAMDKAMSGTGSFSGPVFPEYVNFSYIAHFVEVRIDQSIPRPRVERMVSVIDCGRVISRRTAYSQAYGGLVWGIGAALSEESEIDPRFGGFLNNNIAEYQVPVNADVRRLEVDFIDEPDTTFNPDGLKGLGEVVICGAAAAIANAVHHATGIRVRDLPIRIEDLMVAA